MSNPYRTPFSARRLGSDLLYSLGSTLFGPLSGAARLADRAAGYPVRNEVDELLGAEGDRELQEYNRYMRDMLRQDNPSSFFSRLRTRTGNPYQSPQSQTQESSDMFGPPRSLMGSPQSMYNRVRVTPQNPYLAADAYRRQSLRDFSQRNRSSGGPQQRESTGFMGDMAYELTRPHTVSDIRFEPRDITR